MQGRCEDSGGLVRVFLEKANYSDLLQRATMTLKLNGSQRSMIPHPYMGLASLSLILALSGR